jgi:catechol 2,3-dioxygenase
MTMIGPVMLKVADLPRALAFYRERLGFRVHAEERGAARLGAGASDLLVLIEGKNAVRAVGTTGLFHFAVLLSSRAELARALSRLVETRTPLQGAADHRVSESLYLADPEGNGIELYRDRPRESWVWDKGLVRMTTDPLDVEALLNEGQTNPAPWSGLPPGTIIGHVHLRVAHIAPTERFYCELLGFELTARYGSGASFVAAGGYHHHVAFNTWSGIGAPPAPESAAGLQEFVVELDGTKETELVLARLRAAGVSCVADGLVRDPSGNVVRLTSKRGDDR